MGSTCWLCRWYGQCGVAACFALGCVYKLFWNVCEALKCLLQRLSVLETCKTRRHWELAARCFAGCSMLTRLLRSVSPVKCAYCCLRGPLYISTQTEVLIYTLAGRPVQHHCHPQAHTVCCHLSNRTTLLYITSYHTTSHHVPSHYIVAACTLLPWSILHAQSSFSFVYHTCCMHACMRCPVLFPTLAPLPSTGLLYSNMCQRSIVCM